MKDYNDSFLFKFSWELMVKAYESRFPRNIFMPYLLHSSVLNKSCNKESGNVIVTRQARLDPGLPGWLAAVTGIREFVFIETAEIDQKNRTMTLHRENETLKEKVHLREDTTYIAHPENPNWTRKNVNASIDIKVWTFGLSSNIESFAHTQLMKRLKSSEAIDNKLAEQCLQKEPPSPSHSHSPSPPPTPPPSTTQSHENL